MSVFVQKVPYERYTYIHDIALFRETSICVYVVPPHVVCIRTEGTPRAVWPYDAHLHHDRPTAVSDEDWWTHCGKHQPPIAILTVFPFVLGPARPHGEFPS